MSSPSPKIHLVSFATPRYRHRQLMLGLSARINQVVDEVSDWTPATLMRSGFKKMIPGISLAERGSGFWCWKPFIISKSMERMNKGDLLLYCDVGRIYPFKLLEQPLAPFLQWMDEVGQDVMPGIEIPWNGPMIQWTKRDAFVAMEMDRQDIHSTSPIQASFSLWRVTPSSRALVSEWLTLCSDRQLVSDDPSRFPGGEHPELREHRHDQALWTLLCRKRGLRAMTFGSEKPSFDEKNPSVVAGHLAGWQKVRFSGHVMHLSVMIMERTERFLRGCLSRGVASNP